MAGLIFVLILSGVALLALAVYMTGVYNQLVQVRINVDKSWPISTCCLNSATTRYRNSSRSARAT